jgi:hypothetical protein
MASMIGLLDACEAQYRPDGVAFDAVLLVHALDESAHVIAVEIERANATASSQ